MPETLTKYLIYIGIIVLIALGLAGSGFYLNSVFADRARLKQEVVSLNASNEALARSIAKDREALLQAEKSAQEARSVATVALQRLKEAKNDKASADWLSKPLPDGVRNALRSN